MKFFQDLRARIAQTGAPPLGLHILMGAVTPQKIGNMVTALEQGLIRRGRPSNLAQPGQPGQAD